MKTLLKFSLLLLTMAVLSNIILYQFQDLQSLNQASNDSYSQILLLLDSRKPAKPITEASPNAKFGVASYYSYQIGDYDSSEHYVAAVRDFPRKSWLLVTNLDNGKTVKVLVTDFGPALAVHPDRIIDLSPKAFKEISSDGSLRTGLLKNVSVEIVKK